MFIQVIVLTILITSGFDKIQTEHVKSEESQLSDISEESEETKEFSSKEFYTFKQDNDGKKAIVNEDMSISISEDDEEYYGGYEKQNQPLSLGLRGNNIPNEFSNLKSASNIADFSGSSLNLDKFKRHITIQQLEKANHNPGKSLPAVSQSMSAESKEFNISEIISNKLKRQIQSRPADINIQGNNNRFLSLVNLPLKLKVLANILSEINQEAVGTTGSRTGTDGFSISGNNNRVTNLVDLPLDVKGVLNILSKVNQKTGGPTERNTNQQGPLNGLLGGLLGGVQEEGNEDLLGGLLGGVNNDGLVGGLLGEELGDTLEDLLAVLLANDAEFGNLLGGIFGSDQTGGLLAPLLENLLEAVGSIVEHLLELLTALLGGLLNGLSQHTTVQKHPFQQNVNSPITNSDFTIRGNNNQVTSLINAPIKLKAFINVLSSLKQEIAQQTQPNSATNPISVGSSSQPVKVNDGTLIQGNNNHVSTLLNVAPDADVKLNLLSQITQLLNPGQTKSEHVTNGINGANEFENADEICFDIPIDHSGTSIVGNNNRVSGLVNVKPKINLDLNMLSQLTQTGGSIPKNIPTQKICIPRPTTQAPLTIPTTTAVTPTTNPNEICFDIPVEQSATSIKGNNNRISNFANAQPKINLDLNLLSKLTQTGGSIPSNIATQRICIQHPTSLTPPTIATTTAVTPTTNPNEICFDIPIDQSGSSIIGNNNRVFEAVNVNSNINLALNLLSQINQSGNSLPVKVPTQRICIPIPTTPKPTTAKPTRTTATTTPTPPSPTPEQRCFKRVCTKWVQTRDYKCLTKRDQFPKYTFTYTY